MAEQAIIFEIPSEDTKAPEKEKKLSPVIPIMPPETLEAKGSVIENGGETYEAYRTLGGCLTQTEYETSMKIADSQATANKIYMKNARAYADVAEIKLSVAILRLYAVLRDDHNTPGIPKKLASLGDQDLLAEVLRMKGESEALDKLKNSRILKKP